MKNLLKTMKALSDTNRLKIIKLLQQGPKCVCELQAALQISQPAVSRHLRILEEASLVKSSRDGNWINYELNPDPENIYAAHLNHKLHHWLEQNPEIKDLRERARTLHRRDLK